MRIVKLCVDVVKEHMRWIENHDIAAGGSPIDRDYHDRAVMTMNELVASPIKGALDCLYVACTSLRDLQYVRGIGHPALVRSSITASTSSLWILDDNPQTRRTRALIIAYAQCNSELEFTRGITPDWWSGTTPKTGPMITHAQKRVDGVIAEADHFGIDKAVVKKKPKDSAIVRLGADRIPPSVLDGRQPSSLVVGEWRLLSGRAHGFHWPVMYGNGKARKGDDDRFMVMDSTIPPLRFMGIVRTAMSVARIALDRYAALAGFDEVDVRKPWELR